MSHLRQAPLALILTLALFGCRGGGSGNGGGDPDGGGGGGDDDTVFDVQDPESGMAVGTTVNLRGVVVVATDTFGGRTGGIYVMEPEGGPYSGVFVFAPNAVSSVAPGDLVDVEGGVKDEFGLEDTCDRDSDCTVTEISPPEGGSLSVTVVGSGTVPEPQVLLPQDLAADDTEAEKWEGVLIQFDDVRVFDGPFGVDDDDPTLQSMDVTGPFNVQSALTEFADISEGDCYSSIAGVGYYIFEYRLYPRSAEDLASGGESCPDPEEGDALCGDGMDNDFDGTMDCAGRSCFTAQTSCPSENTDVVSIQDPESAPEEGTLVELTDVVVTARDFNGETLWVQDPGGAGEYNGLSLFNDDQGFDESIVAGSTISVIGLTEEFDFNNDGDNAVTQVSDVVVLDDTPEDGTVEIVSGETLATLLTEPYEGVVVSLDDVATVTAVDSAAHQFTILLGGENVVVDDQIYRYEDAAMDQCLNLTGVMHYNSFDDIVVLLPRSADDVEDAGAVCQ